jgi:hypothetical protein
VNGARDLFTDMRRALGVVVAERDALRTELEELKQPLNDIDPQLLLPDPELMASPEGDMKGLREVQQEARRQVTRYSTVERVVRAKVAAEIRAYAAAAYPPASSATLTAEFLADRITGGTS